MWTPHFTHFSGIVHIRMCSEGTTICLVCNVNEEILRSVTVTNAGSCTDKSILDLSKISNKSKHRYYEVNLTLHMKIGEDFGVGPESRFNE